ncbi:transposase [Dolosigranulum pigrum]|nr:transposase [Dolosigranulum pigrum]
MSKWLISIAERYLQPVFELFDKHLTNEFILHVNETTVKALESDNQTNYLCLFRTGKDHE